MISKEGGADKHLSEEVEKQQLIRERRIKYAGEYSPPVVNVDEQRTLKIGGRG